jgi:hypothetical protein
MSNTTLLLLSVAAAVEGHPFSSTLSVRAGGHPSLLPWGGGGGTVDEEEAGGGVADDLVDRGEDLLGYIAAALILLGVIISCSGPSTPQLGWLGC